MASDKTDLINLENAGVRRDNRWLVRGIDLRIRKGEIVTIIGPNGAGKSTTAKLAVGTIRANEGRVQRQAGLRVGYVPQKLHIDPALPMRVDRLLDLTAKVSPDEKKQALEAVGASHLATAFVQDLSGGEFQRILLARAMVRRPNLLVLDEPVQGVDFASEAMLYNLIRQIRDTTGCGVLMISHDLHIVMADTDTVLCLNGHICCSDSPDSVVSNPEYLRLFVACQLHDCGGNEVSIFMLCTQCERAHEFTDTSIDSRLQSLGNDRGFQAAHKVIEITGLCANCQTAERAARKH